LSVFKKFKRAKVRFLKSNQILYRVIFFIKYIADMEICYNFALSFSQWLVNKKVKRNFRISKRIKIYGKS